MTISCIIKYPSQPEIKGLIIGDRGTEFDVKVGFDRDTRKIMPHLPVTFTP